jgi:menaquinone-dependent protoporphyrinogen oxidase
MTEEDTMNVLVAYASRHGATREIAEWIAEALDREGLEVTLSSVTEPIDVDAHEAFVIGSAAYMGHWLGEASAFVRDHRKVLARAPLWLFSSGPIGTDRIDAKGRDVIEASRPLDFDELADSLHPRDEAIFFGAYDPQAAPVGVIERLGAPFLRLSAVRAAMPAGDFRDRPAIEAWAMGIARELRRIEDAVPIETPA